MMVLGPAGSAKLLKQLSEEEVESITTAIARLDEINPATIESVIEEFHQATAASQLFVRGGPDYAHKLLSEAYDSDTATRLMDRLMKAAGGDLTFESFRKVDPQQLAKFIQDEHPQTIALILSHLDPSQAAALLAQLPVETRGEVAIRMADLDQISPEVVRNIGSVIGQKLRHLGELSREACGGVRAVANMINRLDPNTCAEVLEKVESHDPALFDNIRRFMFVFNDLIEIDDMGIKELMNRVDRKDVMISLKATNDALKEKFMKSLSQRGAQMLLEDMSTMSPVKLKDVDAAQQRIITIARELEKEGVISLKSSPADEYI